MTTVHMPPPGPSVRDWLAKMPAEYRPAALAAIEDRRRDPADRPAAYAVAYAVESPEDAAARRAVQAQAATAYWRRTVPTEYATASFGDLHDDWLRDDGTITTVAQLAGWLDREDCPRLLLPGHSDAGKTHTAYAVGWQAIGRDWWTVAAPVVGWLAQCRPDGEPAAYDRAVQARVLILDDLGREQTTPWVVETLHRLIDDRDRRRREAGSGKLIVTTNLGWPQVTERYGHPLASRLLAGAGIARLNCPPHRKTAAPW